MFFPLDLVLQNIPVSICAVVRQQMKRWRSRALQPCWYQKVLTAWSEGRDGHGARMLPAWALGKPRAAAGLQPEEQLWSRGASPPFAYGMPMAFVEIALYPEINSMQEHYNLLI